MIVERLGVFGMSREEKILPYMKKYLSSKEYSNYVSTGSVKNLLAYFDLWAKTNKKAPIFFDNPNHADTTTLSIMKYIQEQTGYPEKPVRVFLYGVYESLKSGNISVTTVNKNLEKPLPIDPKKLIYGGLIVTGLLAVAWISQNVKGIIPQRKG